VLDGQSEPKKKRYVHFDQLQFLLPLICDGKETSSNIRPPANDTVDEAGRSATDVNSESTAHEEKQFVKLSKIQDSRSCSGSPKGGKSRAKDKQKKISY
jgi:hypothetical protein